MVRGILNRAGRLAAPAALASVLGCGHAPARPAPVILSAPKLSACMPRAMSAAMVLAPDRGRSAEELQKVHFAPYYESFLDAREQKKYIDCLKAERPADYKEKVRQAQGWLKTSRRSQEEHEAFFPAERRIRDVQETFLYPDEKSFTRRVVVIRRDGTQEVVEKTYPKAPAATP